MIILIPTYDSGDGEAAKKLDWNIANLDIQEYKDFTIIISDDSDNNNILDVLKNWKHLNIEYYLNEYIQGPSSNLNYGLTKVLNGSIVHLLMQDDYMSSSGALKVINDAFTDDVMWLFTDYIHTKDYRTFYRRFHPSMNPNIITENTLGTPSGLTMRKTKDTPLFDVNLKYHFDCVFYSRLYKLYGDPKIINDVTMVNLVWDKNITANLTQQEFDKELEYIRENYGQN